MAAGLTDRLMTPKCVPSLSVGRRRSGCHIQTETLPTVRAVLQALRLAGAKRIVLAVPVAPRDTVERLNQEVNEIACLVTPEPFYAAGVHYGDFRVVSQLNFGSRPDHVISATRTTSGKQPLRQHLEPVA